jgi:hypothetical protein
MTKKTRENNELVYKNKTKKVTLKVKNFPFNLTPGLLEKDLPGHIWLKQPAWLWFVL